MPLRNGKIPTTIVTGFLGAGKTSLIRHLIENAGGRRLALVINEFGDLGVDRELLTGCGVEGCSDEDVVELTNGCICCTVADDFLPTIQALLDRAEPPDHIVIETSGLALPKPLVKAFAWPDIRTRVTVDGVVAVIDGDAVVAGRFDNDLAPEELRDIEEGYYDLDPRHPLEELFAEQVECADLVILNKTDLLAPEALKEARTEIGWLLRPAVKIVPAVRGAVDPRILLGLAAAAEDDLDSRPSHHDGDDHDHDDFDSFVLSLDEVADPSQVEARIRAAFETHDILRVKGFLDVRGKPMRHVVQAVGGRVQGYFDRPWRKDERRRSQLVVIGDRDMDRAAVSAALRG